MMSKQLTILERTIALQNKVHLFCKIVVYTFSSTLDNKIIKCVLLSIGIPSE